MEPGIAGEQDSGPCKKGQHWWVNSAPLAKTYNINRIQWMGYIKYTKEFPQEFNNVCSPSVCKDNDCDMWSVKLGFCHRDSTIEYYQTNCRKSCGFCEGEEAGM